MIIKNYLIFLLIGFLSPAGLVAEDHKEITSSEQLEYQRERDEIADERYEKKEKREEPSAFFSGFKITKTENPPVLCGFPKFLLEISYQTDIIDGRRPPASKARRLKSGISSQYKKPSGECQS